MDDSMIAPPAQRLLPPLQNISQASASRPFSVLRSSRSVGSSLSWPIDPATARTRNTNLNIDAFRHTRGIALPAAARRRKRELSPGCDSPCAPISQREIIQATATRNASTLTGPAHDQTARGDTQSRGSVAGGKAEMATDEAYMEFLNKANQDPSQGSQTKVAATTSSARDGELKTTEAGVEVPAAIVQATQEAFYVSDADEPFLPVALAWANGLPNEEEFATLVGHWEPNEAGIEILDPVDWDSQGQYSDLVQAVREASKGNDVRVYRVPGRKASRVEYWVVTTTGGKDGRLLGAKALAIES